MSDILVRKSHQNHLGFICLRLEQLYKLLTMELWTIDLIFGKLGDTVVNLKTPAEDGRKNCSRKVAGS